MMENNVGRGLEKVNKQHGMVIHLSVHPPIRKFNSRAIYTTRILLGISMQPSRSSLKQKGKDSPLIPAVM